MGHTNQNYAMWQSQLVTMMKGKECWIDIEDKDCSRGSNTDVKNVSKSALGNVFLIICMYKDDNLFSIIEHLNVLFVSSRTFSLVAVPFTLFGKRHNGEEDVEKYIDEFQWLRAQLERMRSCAISEEFEVSLLLFSTRRNSYTQSTTAAFRTKDAEAFKWIDLTYDISCGMEIFL